MRDREQYPQPERQLLAGIARRLGESGDTRGPLERGGRPGAHSAHTRPRASGYVVGGAAEERLRSAIQSGLAVIVPSPAKRLAPGPWWRSAPDLPEAQQAGVYAEALDAARAITYGVAPAQTLVALANHLPEGLLAEALDAARAFTFGRDRARALVAFGALLPEGLLAEALDAARAPPTKSIAPGPVAYGAHLPGAQQAGVYAERWTTRASPI